MRRACIRKAERLPSPVPTESKHPIRNGVIIAVTSAAVLYATTFIPGLYHWLLHVLAAVGRFLGKPVIIARWIFFLVCLFCIPTLYRIFWPLFRRSPRGPNFTEYQTDRFFGLIWRWDYSFHSSPQNLWCFCPHCDTQLIYSEDRYPDHVWFTCDHCKLQLHEVSGSKNYALSQVYRQIDRKLRNGEWKTAGTDSALNKRS